jgi:predicted CoA-binding protein
MPSSRETFWNNASFAFVGHSSKKPFPKLSYGELRRQGKKVFAVDPSAESILGDRAYVDLASLPEKVDAVVIEVPREETARWVARAADAGIKHVWIHMLRDTPEALEVARTRDLDLRTGSCAMMYVSHGLSYHTVHKALDKALGRY